MGCKFCKGNCCKAGKQANGQQRFRCKSCKKYQQKFYVYQAYIQNIKVMIPRLVCNSVGVRGIARVLKIAVNTVVTYIKKSSRQYPETSYSDEPTLI